MTDLEQTLKDVFRECGIHRNCRYLASAACYTCHVYAYLVAEAVKEVEARQ